MMDEAFLRYLELIQLQELEVPSFRMLERFKKRWISCQFRADTTSFGAVLFKVLRNFLVPLIVFVHKT